MPDEQPVRKVVDSTVAIAFARFFMPIAIAVIGWFMVTTVTGIKDDIKENNKTLWAAVVKMNDTLVAHSTALGVLGIQIQEHQKAIDHLSVGTPKP